MAKTLTDNAIDVAPDHVLRVKTDQAATYSKGNHKGRAQKCGIVNECKGLGVLHFRKLYCPSPQLSRR